MKNWLTGILAVTIQVFSITAAQAQEIEMADTFRAEGKIYVVVGIILIVLGGLFAYLFLLDRKITRVEKELNK